MTQDQKLIVVAVAGMFAGYWWAQRKAVQAQAATVIEDPFAWLRGYSQ